MNTYPEKVYVGVTVEFDEVGKMKPILIKWPDGREFEIDRLLSVKPGAARSGGSGIIYLCRILGKEVPLYYSEMERRWWCDGRKK